MEMPEIETRGDGGNVQHAAAEPKTEEKSETGTSVVLHVDTEPVGEIQVVSEAE